jgi:hypothetical protein
MILLVFIKEFNGSHYYSTVRVHFSFLKPLFFFFFFFFFSNYKSYIYIYMINPKILFDLQRLIKM